MQFSHIETLVSVSESHLNKTPFVSSTIQWDNENLISSSLTSLSIVLDIIN